MLTTKPSIGALCGRLWRERRPVLIAAVVFVAGVPTVIFMARTGTEAPSATLASARQVAENATAKGEYATAYETLKRAKNQAKTKAQQVALYSDLAAAAANNGQSVEAIDYLEIKHRLDPSTAKQDAAMLATLYGAKGDKSKAIEQYKIAITYYRSLAADPTVDAQIESLEAIVAELEGSEQ